jgi:hypothetical protein
MNLDTCNSDDSWTYNEDGTADFSIGAIKCNPSDKETTLNWVISDEGDSLNLFIGNDFRNTFYIESISANQLILLSETASSPMGTIRPRSYYNK